MKIGILTFHRANNYGAVLQCYALQEFLKSLGHDTYVIDYRPDYVEKRYKVFSRRYWIVRDLKKTFKKLLTEPYLCYIRYKRNKELDVFIKNRYNLYPYSPEESDLDVVILGSDQIWNPKLTGNGFDEVFFGKGYKCRKVAYAASNRSETLTPEEISFYKSHLCKLDFIGVRETKLQNLLQPYTSKKVYLNIDPTLLMSKNWTAELNMTRVINTNYVMLYEVTRHLENRKLAKEYAKQESYSFVELTGALALSYRYTQNLDQTASPEKFLCYLKYASCIFTTSFHGTALSVLFEKDFYYIKQNTSADFRIETLLKELGLENRIIDNIYIPQSVPIVYDEVRRKLDTFRSESVNYLKHALTD